jgi:hypothetical protein
MFVDVCVLDSAGKFSVIILLNVASLQTDIVITSHLNSTLINVVFKSILSNVSEAIVVCCLMVYASVFF